MWKATKKRLRPSLATAARILLARLAPGQPALAANEWPGCQFSFSQFGEDRVLIQLLREVVEPLHRVYVDVGAHDPVVFSNTMLLHKLGWQGINIDASEESIGRFRTLRPMDRNVCCAVSDACREFVYHRYATSAANRIGDPNEIDTSNVLGEKPISTTRLVTRPLNDILSEHVRSAEQVGFLNIDCEGHDMVILRHLDWTRWRPKVVAVESHDETTTEEMTVEMIARGYQLVANCLLTLIFQNQNG